MPGTESSIDDMARLWAIRTAEGDMPAERQAEMEAWLNASSRHLGAYVRARAVWSRLDRMVAVSQPQMAPVSDSHTASPRRRWLYFGAGIAASIALLVGIGGIVTGPDEQRIAASDESVYRTTLEDGSRLLLDSGSAVAVRFDKVERRLELERGQAFFDVAHNERIPFVVETTSLRVTAVGTNFSVGLRDGGREALILVTEGAVRVQRKGGGAATIVRANEQLAADADRLTRSPLNSREVERQSAWQRGLLIFNGETLEVAAEAVNRYASKPVVIADESLARQKFVGMIHTGNSHSFANAAAAAFDASVEERPDSIILRTGD
ncbi:FecR family protein [Sphingopyxis sp. R3-92]|uniref:FecR family protein n=1 Tax=Sphingopyxis sp. R3-92 TaxID=3158553 RepID=UPI003EE6F0D4